MNDNTTEGENRQKKIQDTLVTRRSFRTNSTTTDESLLACLLAEFLGVETGTRNTNTPSFPVPLSVSRVFVLRIRHEDVHGEKKTMSDVLDDLLSRRPAKCFPDASIDRKIPFAVRFPTASVCIVPIYLFISRVHDENISIFFRPFYFVFTTRRTRDALNSSADVPVGQRTESCFYARVNKT